MNMATFFGKPEVQYKPPGDDGDIPVAEFLHSCNGIVEFVSKFLIFFVLGFTCRRNAEAEGSKIEGA